MKALNIHEFKSYKRQKIEELPSPKLRAGHLRISVAAAGLNFPDILMAEGKYQIKPPFPFIPGSECSGTITEVSDDVEHLKVGDKVAAMVMNGAFATEVVCSSNLVWKIGTIPFDKAAGIALVYGTSYYALKQRAKLKKGDTLLVLGAAGGVGLAAVELGKAMGANVIAAASTNEKLQICKIHGADELINYSDEDLKRRVKELGGCDVIYDPIGDKYSEPAMRTLKWYGRYLVIGFAAGEIPKIPLNLALLKSIDIRGVFWGAWTARCPKDHQTNMKEILSYYASGKINPRISNSYSLDNFDLAFDELTSRKAMGKVIIKMI
ncbi:NADPH:quinone oxidoreductase family protein [Hellea sp.]|jgi:NADPH2:quinone reductase|nr:NADPH:quinone oxidoreductase family protein [Hellea sp.]MDB4844881.1 NADPH:quinone oxidoreductase family protein [Hellea sp.]MDC0650626.1 NADPH:quinone oxidoreductase family protein [Hellea sp.]MDC1062217.1 NADPH:quinone oxidoreductase family protein [Hellea sp.]MDC1089294.1 NADPH:quinone oxidoreductase family protein [Hellea sp.]